VTRRRTTTVLQPVELLLCRCAAGGPLGRLQCPSYSFFFFFFSRKTFNGKSNRRELSACAGQHPIHSVHHGDKRFQPPRSSSGTAMQSLWRICSGSLWEVIHYKRREFLHDAGSRTFGDLRLVAQEGQLRLIGLPLRLSSGWKRKYGKCLLLEHGPRLAAAAGHRCPGRDLYQLERCCRG